MNSIRREKNSSDAAPLDSPTFFPVPDTALNDADFVPELVLALTLLDLLERTRMPMLLGDIACALNISASATDDLCEQMLSKAYLRQTGDGKLTLGPTVARLARNAV